MTIFSKHPYSFIVAGVGIVFLIVVLTLNTGTAPRGPTTYVSGGSVLFSPTNETPAAPSSPATPVGPVPSPATLPTQPAASTSLSFAQSTPQSAPSAQQPSPAPAQQQDSSSIDLIKQAYALLPSGFSLPTATIRTPTQQALYDYGNQAGLAVMTFQNAHSDAADVLKRWLGSRQDPVAQAAVRSIATDMIATGDALMKLSPPTAAASANTALASSLHDAGTNMLAVVDASGSDDTLTTAIETYDASADAFTSAFLSLSTLLSASSVTFSSTDTGQVFQFNSGGGL